jgi:hypothetical protein
MIQEIITDLEIEVACMLDSFEEVRPSDLERLQDKLARLYDEYILSITRP